MSAVNLYMSLSPKRPGPGNWTTWVTRRVEGEYLPVPRVGEHVQLTAADLGLFKDLQVVKVVYDSACLGAMVFLEDTVCTDAEEQREFLGQLLGAGWQVHGAEASAG